MKGYNLQFKEQSLKCLVMRTIWWATELFGTKGHRVS